MLPVIPSSQELDAWFFANRTLPTITLLREQLVLDFPSWLVSKEVSVVEHINLKLNSYQRMRGVRQRLNHVWPTMVAFAPTASNIDVRDEICRAMELGASPSSRMSGTNLRPGLEDIAGMMKYDQVRPCGRFYERDADTVDWYYQGEPVNAIGVLFAGREVVKGRIVIAKNGPQDGAWDPSIDYQSLARTIWWYMRSGVDPSSLAAQRDLERLVMAMY
ncbi:hypothetical protein C8R44DRAFT_871995 [Mycena epipterygia]|nr:hypothetical protein C8R44DRAFT_871995 [Mycena epipterygia]